MSQEKARKEQRLSCPPLDPQLLGSTGSQSHGEDNKQRDASRQREKPVTEETLSLSEKSVQGNRDHSLNMLELRCSHRGTRSTWA